MHDPQLKALIQQLQILPGIGERGAKRLTQHLLQFNRQEGIELGRHLMTVLAEIKHCQRCRNHTTALLCPLCQRSDRASAQLCVLDSPSSIEGLEAAGYKGFYFVLFGLMSPIKGIGPVELGLGQLKAQVSQSEVQELIIALPGNVEGEATTQIIIDQMGDLCTVTRLAQGVPRGSDLANLDSLTLSQALLARSQI